jgi:signal transduction histidine kinase
MVDLCLKNGEGFVDYLWPKPTKQGLTKEQPKISYVRLFDQWSWILGTGVYIDDIEAEAQRRLDAIIDELNQIFTKVRIAETGYMFVFNGKREMLVHPNIVGAKFATLKNPTTGALFFDELVAAAKTPGKSLDYTWDKPGFEGEYRFPKRTFITYFEPLDWYIGISMYTDELAKPGKQLRERVLYLGLLSLSVTLLIAIALSRSMIKPLWRLAQSAKEIEKKGLAAADIPISGTSETRELGYVLEQMVISLRKAEEELRGANWELEEFVSTVSHDLRTPLTPIIGFAEYLRKEYSDRLDEHALDCLAEIEAQGYKMIAHMEDLLTLAKVGYLERPDEPVDVDKVVRQAIVELEDKISESAVEVMLHPLPRISIPALLLSQIFTNLISNAIHYAGHSSSPIEVGGERTDSKIMFYVRDHGPGVLEKERKRIFHVFHRGSTSKEIKGTGLGLAIVQKVAQTYGGRAWVDETPGGGCTFRVEFEDSGSEQQ